MPKTQTPVAEEALKTIESKLDVLIDLLTPKVKEVRAAAEVVPVPSNPFPIPTDYREVVDTVLNKSFGIEVTPLADRPAFQLDIIVPDKYSSITPEHKKMYGADHRVRIISYAEGTTGVRDWAERVLGSFNQDTKSMIALDRQIP